MNSLILIVLLVCASIPRTGFTQERRKITISNATLSYSALPLVAAREWKLFEEQALNVEVILMRSAEAAASSQIEKPEDLKGKRIVWISTV